MPQLTYNAPERAPIAHADTSRIDLRPGKFQGEPLYVRMFWDSALQGAADLDVYQGETLISCFELSDADYRAHPGLIGCKVLALWEDACGFVHHAALSDANYIALQNQSEDE